MKHVTLVVCAPTSMPGPGIPGSRQTQCSKCERGVWLSPSSIRDMPDQQGEIHIVCIPCANADILKSIKDGDPIDFVPTTENQKRDLRAARI